MAYQTAARWYLVSLKDGKVKVWSHQMDWTVESGKAATFQHPTQATLVLEGLQRMGIGDAKCVRVNDLDALLMQQMLTQISDGDY